jgi:hypothetical protein
MSKIWQALKDAELSREPLLDTRPVRAGLTPTQQQAIRALLVHGSVSDAASACGVSARSLEGWLKTPRFVAAYHAASRAARARR